MSKPNKHEDAVITIALHVCKAITVTTGYWLLTCLLWLSAAVKEKVRHWEEEEEIRGQMVGTWQAL